MQHLIDQIKKLKYIYTTIWILTFGIYTIKSTNFFVGNDLINLFCMLFNSIYYYPLYCLNNGLFIQDPNSSFVTINPKLITIILMNVIYLSTAHLILILKNNYKRTP